MSLQIQNTADQSALTTSIVVYGAPKVGKTRLAITAPSAFVICCDPDGVASLKGHTIPYVACNTFNDVWSTIEDKSLWREMQKHGIKTVFLDSATAVAYRVLQEETRYQIQGGKGSLMQAYGTVANKMRDLMDGFWRLAQFHRVATFYEQPYEKGDAETPTITGGPHLPGQKLNAEAPYWPSELYRMFFRPNKTVALQTQGSMFYLAGSRGGGLAAEEEPNLTNIFAKLAGHPAQKGH
jgi:hypothetical protein